MVLLENRRRMLGHRRGGKLSALANVAGIAPLAASARSGGTWR